MDNSINSCGTLGDSFIILCKIFNENINEINHFTKHRKELPTIGRILSLKEGVTFNTLDSRPDDPIAGYIKEGETYTAFPELNLPDVSKFVLPSEYIVVQLQSGISIERTPWKRLTNQDLKSIPKDKTIVLIGTDNGGHNLGDVVDLRNKTDILEAFSIISNSSGLYGPVGLLTLFAPSRKVSANVFIKNQSDEHAMHHRSGQIKEWKKYMNYVR